MRAASALLPAAALLAPLPAAAQAYQCRAPAVLEPARPARIDGPVRRVPAARYTLAASWSPEFCRTRSRDPAQRLQCSGSAGRFGFILHGLWPEARAGPPPQWCALTPRPSPALIRANLCMTPSPTLIEHEWAKHGSCMARSPDGYFRVAGILWRSLRFPDMDRLSRQKALNAGAVRREFVLANPGWRADAVGLTVNRGGWLQELRLCYSRKFLPQPCPARGFGPRDAAPLKIWRGL